MFLNFEEKKMLINSYFYSSFNYCPLVWIFSSAKSQRGKNRALHLLHEDFVLSNEELLQKACKETMKINRLRSLSIEICKLINNINPTYMNETFKLRKISRAVLSNYIFHSIQYRNGWLAASDLFYMFTQSIKFYKYGVQ